MRPLAIPAAVGAVTAVLLVGGYWLLVADGDDEDSGAIDADVTALGAEVYAAHCAVCHGAELEGAEDWQTPGEDGLLPPPPHDSTGHTWHHGDGLLFRIVQEGCLLYADPDDCAMPAFGDRLSDAEIVAVLEYIKTWWGPLELDFQQRMSEADPYPAPEPASP